MRATRPHFIHKLTHLHTIYRGTTSGSIHMYEYRRRVARASRDRDGCCVHVVAKIYGSGSALVAANRYHRIFAVCVPCARCVYVCVFILCGLALGSCCPGPMCNAEAVRSDEIEYRV